MRKILPLLILLVIVFTIIPLSAVTEYPLPMWDIPLNMEVDINGNIWFGTMNGKIYKFNTTDETFEWWQIDMHGLTNNPITMVALEEDPILGVLGVWFTEPDPNYIGRLSPSDGSINEWQVLGKPWTIEYDGNGMVWIGLQRGEPSDGIVKFNPATEEFIGWGKNIVILDMIISGNWVFFVATYEEAEVQKWAVGRFNWATDPEGTYGLYDLPSGRRATSMTKDPGTTNFWVADNYNHAFYVVNASLYPDPRWLTVYNIPQTWGPSNQYRQPPEGENTMPNGIVIYGGDVWVSLKDAEYYNASKQSWEPQPLIAQCQVDGTEIVDIIVYETPSHPRDLLDCGGDVCYFGYSWPHLGKIDVDPTVRIYSKTIDGQQISDVPVYIDGKEYITPTSPLGLCGGDKYLHRLAHNFSTVQTFNQGDEYVFSHWENEEGKTISRKPWFIRGIPEDETFYAVFTLKQE